MTAPHLASEPLTPIQCDLRGLLYMPLDCARLLESDTFALTTGDEFKAALTLWCRSWSQVPAASLPDDERILAKWVGVSLSEWRGLKEQALRGWILAMDGRLYHPVVAEKALTAWLQRLSLQERSAKANARPGRAFAYDPAVFEQMRFDAEASLARVQAMLAPLPDGAASPPTGTADRSLLPPTANDNRSEEEGEAEGEGGEKNPPARVAATPPGSVHRSDVQAAVDAYNEAAVRLGLPQARALTERRRKAIEARLKGSGLHGWRKVLEAVARSPHHLGRNDRGWKADIEFIAREEPFQKFLEADAASMATPQGLAHQPSGYLALAAQAARFDLIEGEAA